MFFNLTVLGGIEQTLFTDKLKPHVMKNIFVRTLLPADTLRLKSYGSNSFIVCLSNTADTITGIIITLLLGEEKMISVADFGAPDLRMYRFLNAENKNDGDTAFGVEIE